MSGLPVRRSTIYRILTKELKITYKKTLFAAEQNREDVKQAREKWEIESKNWDEVSV